MIETSIHQRLSGITAHVYPTQPTDNAAPPFLIYTVQDSQPQRTLQGSGSLTKHTVTVEAWAETLTECNALLAQVRTQLDGYQGGQMHRAFCDDPGQAEEEEDGFHKTATYTVWTTTANIISSTSPTAVIQTGDDFAEIRACNQVLRLDCTGLTLNNFVVGPTPDLSAYARKDQSNTFAVGQTVNGPLTF